jgi:hypothetical protein
MFTPEGNIEYICQPDVEIFGDDQLYPISIYIVYISVLLVVFHMMNEG